MTRKSMLVIGDLMLDKYLIGDTSRISPEAPVPVVAIKNEEYQLGGALNVAHNLAKLDINAIPIGIIGSGYHADICLNLCRRQKISIEGIVQTGRRTTIKARVVSNGQHIVRVDKEDTYPIDELLENDIIRKVDELISRYYPSAILISDYNKGVLTYNVIQHILNIAEEYSIKIFVDPKFNNFNLYKNVYVLKPNLHEATEYVKRHNLVKNTSIERPELLSPTELGRLIMKKLNPKYLIITLGKEGIFLLKDNGKVYFTSIDKRHVYDVTGAGDVVLSVLAYCDSIGLSIEECVNKAVLAGSYVVTKFGTSVIDSKFIYSTIVTRNNTGDDKDDIEKEIKSSQSC